MDLFDTGTYYSSCVPVKACTSPLLKCAAVACAAKQMGRADGSVTIALDLAREQQVNFNHRAVMYNDKAVSLLLEMLQETPGEQSLVHTKTVTSWIGTNAGNVPGFESRILQPDACYMPFLDLDELLTGTVILSMVELLNTSSLFRSCHPDEGGAFSKINEIDTLLLHLLSTTRMLASQQHLSLSRAWKAAFWNYARQDFLSTCKSDRSSLPIRLLRILVINECQTRLDTEDLLLWKDAGILLDGEGLVRSSVLHGDDVMQEGMMGNALMWLTSKIINFIAAADGLYPVQPSDMVDSPLLEAGSPIGVNQKTLLERWAELEKELNVWYNGLPGTFQPSTKLYPSYDSSNPDVLVQAYCPEIWYSNPICGRFLMDATVLMKLIDV